MMTACAEARAAFIWSISLLLMLLPKAVSAAAAGGSAFIVSLDATVEPSEFARWLEHSANPRLLATGCHSAFRLATASPFTTTTTTTSSSSSEEEEVGPSFVMVDTGEGKSIRVVVAFDVFDIELVPVGAAAAAAGGGGPRNGSAASDMEQSLRQCSSVEHLRHVLMANDPPPPRSYDDGMPFRVVRVEAPRIVRLMSQLDKGKGGGNDGELPRCSANSINVSRHFALDGIAHRGQGVRVGLFDTGIRLDERTKRCFGATSIQLCMDFTQTRDGRRGADAGAGFPIADGYCDDGHGHGTFVAGIVASTTDGIAPDASLFIFKVFSDSKQSYTSWLVRALTIAMQLGLDVINMSIGGEDYFDDLFTSKVEALMERGTTVVTASGNMGPHHGSILSPADLAETIAVGSVGTDGELSVFSSRGMTLSELPLGIGRPKPDIVTVGENLCGVALNGGYRVLSGTSVAAPIVTAAIALAIGKLLAESKEVLVDSARVLPSARWLLAQSSDVMPGKSVFSVGMGLLNITSLLQLAIPQPASDSSSNTLGLPLHCVPPALHFQFCSDVDGVGGRSAHEPCKGLWPLSANPIYAMPSPNTIQVNVTVYRSTFTLPRDRKSNMGGSSHKPKLIAELDQLRGENTLMRRSVAGTWLREVVEIKAPCIASEGALLAGFCHVTIKSLEGSSAPPRGTINDAGDSSSSLRRALLRPVLHDDGRTYTATDLQVDGQLSITEEVGGKMMVMTPVRLPLRFALIRLPPPRHRRVLWDTQRSILYPSLFVPRDDVRQRDALFDSAADDPFTNFMSLFAYMQLELRLIVQRLPTGTFLNDEAFLSSFGTLMIVDPEEDFFIEEVHAVVRLVKERRCLNLLLVSDWSSDVVRKSLGYFDSNLGAFWEPITAGGCNVHGVNKLLSPMGLALSSSLVASGPVPIPGWEDDPPLWLRSAGSVHHKQPADRGGSSSSSSPLLHRWRCDAKRVLSDVWWVNNDPKGSKPSPQYLDISPLALLQFTGQDESKFKAETTRRRSMVLNEEGEAHNSIANPSGRREWRGGKVAVLTDSSLFDDASNTAPPMSTITIRRLLQAIFTFLTTTSPSSSSLDAAGLPLALGGWCEQLEERNVLRDLFMPVSGESDDADASGEGGDLTFAARTEWNITLAQSIVTSLERRRYTTSTAANILMKTTKVKENYGQTATRRVHPVHHGDIVFEDDSTLAHLPNTSSAPPMLLLSPETSAAVHHRYLLTPCSILLILVLLLVVLCKRHRLQYRHRGGLLRWIATSYRRRRYDTWPEA